MEDNLYDAGYRGFTQPTNLYAVMVHNYRESKRYHTYCAVRWSLVSQWINTNAL
jgi:hypothetical protein